MAYTGLEIKVQLRREVATLETAPTWAQRKRIQKILESGAAEIERLERLLEDQDTSVRDIRSQSQVRGGP